MAMGNGGEKPLLRNVVRSSSSEKRLQLQKQFDAWMNSLNIAKVPGTVSREILQKGKEKEARDSPIPNSTSNPIQELGSSGPEPQSWQTPLEHQEAAKETENNSFSTNGGTNSKDQPDVAVASNTFNAQTNSPSQVYPGYGVLDYQNPQVNYGFEVEQDLQLWQDPPIPWQQVEPNASNFGHYYQSEFPQSFNPNFSEIIFETPENYQWQIPSPPNMELIDSGNSKKEGNQENGDGNYKSCDENDENGVIDDEKTKVSPPPSAHPTTTPPSVQDPPSSSEVPCDLNEIFPSLDPLGDDEPWTEKIIDGPISEWDHSYFP